MGFYGGLGRPSHLKGGIPYVAMYVHNYIAT